MGKKRKWDPCSQRSGLECSATKRCVYLWLVLTPLVRPPSCINSSSVKSSPQFQLLVSTLRRSPTKTSPSTCGMSVVKIKSDNYGDITTPTLKVSSLSLTLTIAIELKTPEKSSTK